MLVEQKMKVASGACRRRRLEQVQRAVRIDREVGLRVGGRPVVRRLGGGVDHELEEPRELANTRSSASTSRMSSSTQRNESP